MLAALVVVGGGDDTAWIEDSFLRFARNRAWALMAETTDRSSGPRVVTAPVAFAPVRVTATSTAGLEVVLPWRARRCGFLHTSRACSPRRARSGGASGSDRRTRRAPRHRTAARHPAAGCMRARSAPGSGT